MAAQNNKTAGKVVVAFGALIGLWATAALVGGLSQAGSIGELARQYMTATGMITPFYTAVDYISYVKGVEYLIVVAFLVTFPAFYSYVEEDTEPKKITV